MSQSPGWNWVCPSSSSVSERKELGFFGFFVEEAQV